MHYRYFLMILFFISGCATMNSSFTCKTPDGVMCHSLDDVNAMVDRGEIGHGAIGGQIALNFTSMKFAVPYAKTPLRDGEEVMRVWVMPYEDSSGNYHETSFLYTVIKPSHWIGAPPEEITDIE